MTPLISTYGSSSIRAFGRSGLVRQKSPVNPPITGNLILWLDGKSYTGGPTWFDSSSQQNDFQIANPSQPLTHNPSSGKFTGFLPTRYWKSSGNWHKVLKQQNGGNGFTAFVSLKHSEGTINWSQWRTDGSTSTWGPILSSGDGNNVIDAWASPSSPFTFTCEDGAATNDGNNRMFVNGSQVTSGTVSLTSDSVVAWSVYDQAGTTTPHDLLIGVDPTALASTPTNCYIWPGSISSVIMYNRILSNSEVSSVTTFIRNRFGI